MKEASAMAFTDIEMQRIKRNVGGLCKRRTIEGWEDKLGPDHEIAGYSKSGGTFKQ
jgi:hypothetical protein